MARKERLEYQNDKNNRRAFVVAYLEAALWSSTAYGVPESEDDESFDTSMESYGFTLDDIDPVAKRKAIRDCLDFWYGNSIDLFEAEGGTPEQHGHDFWLTRNRHGAGFWDRGYGSTGQALADAARLCGECDLYVNDGKIYGF